jgi:hypothetical protein
MGGDRAPGEVVAGALDAASEGIEIVLFGAPGIETHGLELIEASDVIEMHEKPAEAVRAKPNSSLVAAVHEICTAFGLVLEMQLPLPFLDAPSSKVSESHAKARKLPESGLQMAQQAKTS